MSAYGLAPSHPAPHRGRISLIGAGFGLLAAPGAWAAHLIISYALSSTACFPGGEPVHVPVWSTLRTTLWGIDLIAVAIGVAAGMIAWRSWRLTRAEAEGGAHALVDAGEGRTRFLAVCGMMASGGFLLALLFASIGLLVVPACAGW
jgi:hypothetical protein